MAYTAIPAGDRDAESPITVTLIARMIDNPIAIAAGDSGAPQIQTAAIADSAVTTIKINDGAVKEEKHTAIVAGHKYTYSMSSPEDEHTSTSAAYSICMFGGNALIAQRAGTYRITWEHKCDRSGTSNSKIYKNFVAIGSEKTVSTTVYIDAQEDIVLAAGDIISLYSRDVATTHNVAKNLAMKAATKPFG